MIIAYGTWITLYDTDTTTMQLRLDPAGGLTLRHLTVDGKGNIFPMSINATAALCAALRDQHVYSPMGSMPIARALLDNEKGVSTVEQAQEEVE